MSWFKSGAEARSGWDLGFVVALLPWLTQRAASRHLAGISASGFCLLPRITSLGLQSLSTSLILGDGTPRPLPNWPAIGRYGLPIPTVFPVFPEISPGDGSEPFSLSVWTVKHSHPDTRSRAEPSYYGLLRFPVAQSLELLSFMLTVGLVVYAVVSRDGPALIGLVLLSWASVACSYRHWLFFWRHAEQERPDTVKREEEMTPVIIVTPTDAVWVLLCDGFGYGALISGRFDHDSSLASFSRTTCCCGPSTTPARESFNTWLGRICSGLGCVLLANSRFNMQLAVSATYLLLTLLFFTLPPDDLRAKYLQVNRQYHHAGAADAHLSQPNRSPTEIQPSFARTLWYAIKTTRSTHGVSSLIHARYTEPEEDLAGWRQWIQEAEAHMDDEWWTAEGEKRRLVDGDEHAYDYGAEAEEEPNREPSMEITPVPVSQW